MQLIGIGVLIAVKRRCEAGDGARVPHRPDWRHSGPGPTAEYKLNIRVTDRTRPRTYTHRKSNPGVFSADLNRFRNPIPISSSEYSSEFQSQLPGDLGIVGKFRNLCRAAR